MKKKRGGFRRGLRTGYNEGIENSLFAFQKSPDPNGMDKSLISQIGYRLGRIGADVAGDHSRGMYWRWNHPLAITQWAGNTIASKAGLGAGAAAAGGLLLTNVLDMSSGNVDLRNIGEAGRPMGFSSIFKKEKEEMNPTTGQMETVVDATKTSNPLAEFGSRYFLGRTGNLLPWDEFSQERPDVSAEEYQRYQSAMRNPTLFGLEEANPVKSGVLGAVIGSGISAKRFGPKNFGAMGKGALAGAIAGAIAPKLVEPLVETRVIQGTRDGLEGDEIRFMGYRIPAKAALTTAAAGGAIYAGARYAKHKGMFPGLFASQEATQKTSLSKYSNPRMTQAVKR